MDQRASISAFYPHAECKDFGCRFSLLKIQED